MPDKPIDPFSVMCPYCHAPINGPCVNEITGQPLQRFDAHLVRVKAAKSS